MPDPDGFRVHVANVGIKDDELDFCLLGSDVPAVTAAVFTRSRFAGPSVGLSRAVAAAGVARGVVVVSRNANVATGPRGAADARSLQARAARTLGCEPGAVYVASTGVIGRPYPPGRLDAHFDRLRWPADATATTADAAQAIMTTDTRPKRVERRVGDATVVGFAKGVGMIEPDMATLLAFFLTDAAVDGAELDAAFRRVVAVTFNALSIDSDTSTSDTALVLANGRAGPVPMADLEQALGDAALELVRMIAADGEGASRVIEATVGGARDDDQAKAVAKAIVNSPLVKTAVHGADPNWGRVAMAVGKVPDTDDVDPERVRIAIGGVPMYPPAADDSALAAAAEHLRGEVAHIDVDLGIADGAFTCYGCDLTDGYVRINADYTT